MNPRIETITEKKLVGHALEMSLVANKTQELFSGFMPHKKQVTNLIPLQSKINPFLDFAFEKIYL